MSAFAIPSQRNWCQPPIVHANRRPALQGLLRRSASPARAWTAENRTQNHAYPRLACPTVYVQPCRDPEDPSSRLDVARLPSATRCHLAKPLAIQRQRRLVNSAPAGVESTLHCATLQLACRTGVARAMDAALRPPMWLWQVNTAGGSTRLARVSVERALVQQAVTRGAQPTVSKKPAVAGVGIKI